GAEWSAWGVSGRALRLLEACMAWLHSGQNTGSSGPASSTQTTFSQAGQNSWITDHPPSPAMTGEPNPARGYQKRLVRGRQVCFSSSLVMANLNRGRAQRQAALGVNGFSTPGSSALIVSAERAGFEPAVESPPHSISSAAPSAARSPLRNDLTPYRFGL